MNDREVTMEMTLRMISETRSGGWNVWRSRQDVPG